jgi:hypothetical protein
MERGNPSEKRLRAGTEAAARAGRGSRRLRVPLVVAALLAIPTIAVQDRTGSFWEPFLKIRTKIGDRHLCTSGEPNGLALPGSRQIRYRLPPPVLRCPLTSPFREMPTESTCPNASRFVTSYLTAYAIGKTGLVVLLHTGREHRCPLLLRSRTSLCASVPSRVRASLSP